MNRREVYDARLEPVEGSEQGGTRPVKCLHKINCIFYY